MRGMYELWKRAAMNKEQGIHNWKRFPFQSTNSVLLLVANVRTIFSDKGMVYYHDLAMRTEHRNGDCGEISNGEYISIYIRGQTTARKPKEKARRRGRQQQRRWSWFQLNGASCSLICAKALERRWSAGCVVW